MTSLEICLVIIGLVFVACSFLFSEHLMSNETKEDALNGVNVAGVTEEIVKREVEAEVANIIDDKLEAMEVRVDKITSEKLMAMGEFSDDIQKRISENHDEVMFLYNMLNDKEEVLKNTIRDIEAVKTSVKKMAIVNDVARDVTESKPASQPAKKVKVVKVAKPVVKEKAEVIEDNKGEAEEFHTEESVTQTVGASVTVEKPVETIKQAQPEQKPVRKREVSNNNQMILMLYSQGKSNIEIAKELGLGIGEVRLVIDLFNNR